MCLARGMAWGGVITLAGMVLAPAGGAEAPPTENRILETFAEEFVPLTPGKGKFPASFRMGSTAADAPDAEKPAATITFPAPFAMARYEVTQELYQAVMGKNPSKWKGPRNSVEMVSWDEANDFCRKATDRLRRLKRLGADEVIRLPSEAEWEYACRAGTNTAYSFGDKEADLKAHAWYKANSKGEDPPVGRKKPNAWGLYDMHGYIWEWCADAWHPTLKSTPTNGRPWTNRDQKERVLRGGSWDDPATRCRCAYRHHEPRTFRSDKVGFRCVRAAVVKEGTR